MCRYHPSHDCVGEDLEYPAFLLPPDLFSPPQHHLCLPSSGDHGDEALQHQRGGGAHVPRSGTGLVQRYILCPRIPDVGSLQYHDSEGQCFPQSFLWLHPWDLPRQRERVGAKRKMLLRVDMVELQRPPDQLAITAERQTGKGSLHPLSPSLFSVDDFWRLTAFLLADGCGYSGICLR